MKNILNPSAKAIQDEFNAGEASGSKHGTLIHGTTPESSAVLWSENIRKANTGKTSEFPLIRAYWQGYLSGLKKVKLSRTGKLRAHVACDYEASPDGRVFTFTPVNAENKSIAAIQLNGKGETLSARVTVSYEPFLPALIRWARVYLNRSIPLKIV